MNSYINPLATWLGPLPGTNFDNGRVDTDGTQHSMQWVSATDPSFIVLHTMVGHTDSATGRFRNPAAQVSATYGVDLDGTLVQWLDEKDAPYAEGNWEYNLNSIAIEHEDNSSGGNYVGGYTDVQYEASAKLVRDICGRYGIPINRTYVIKHKEVPGSSTACPDDLDVERIVKMAAGTWVSPKPTPPAPPASYPLSDTPPAGTHIQVVVPGVVMQNARFCLDPNGQDMGAAPYGAGVTIWEAVYDGSQWWDHIESSQGPRSDNWWLIDAVVDTSSVAHPAAANPTPAAFWNDVNKPAPTTPPTTPTPPSTPTPDDDSIYAKQADLHTLALQVSTLTARLEALEIKLANVKGVL